MQGVAAIARAGVGVIVDDVFLRGAAQQEHWRVALAGVNVLWVGVRCPPEVAAERERTRSDRSRAWPPRRRSRSIAASHMTWMSTRANAQLISARARSQPERWISRAAR
jgi:chloramphenicol 3-O-phosphotransferase